VEGNFKMKAKYDKKIFGICPQFECNYGDDGKKFHHAVLPCGISNDLNVSKVKVYCPNCEDIMAPGHGMKTNVDGAYFGTDFPYAFMERNEE
jgi:casein kinase II subunit beta